MVLAGNDAVRAFLSGLHDAGFTSIAFEEEHVRVLGSLGYQYGMWTLHGAESGVGGYVVAVWRHDGSDWRVEPPGARIRVESRERSSGTMQSHERGPPSCGPRVRHRYGAFDRPTSRVSADDRPHS